jgi:hypothetical protein
MKKPGKPPREHLEADEVLSMIRAADLRESKPLSRSLITRTFS